MVTAIASPRLERAGRKTTLVLDEKCRGTLAFGSFRQLDDRRFRFAKTDRIAIIGQKFVPFPHARRSLGKALGIERSPCSLKVITNKERLSRPAEVVRTASFVSLTRQGTFEKRYIRHSTIRILKVNAFDLKRAVNNSEALMKHLTRSRQENIRDPIVGATRCAVSAVSVVLSGQT